MTTRTLINAVCVSAALFPAALASAQPRPVPTPRPIPTPVEQDRPAIEAQQLAIGESVVGGLNDSDYATADGKRVDYYQVQLTEGQAYHFSVVGQGFPVTVEVLEEDGSELRGAKFSTDDGVFVLYTAHTGVYTVAVSTENAGDSGRYILHAVEGDENLPLRPNQSGDVAVRDSTEPFNGTLNDQSETSAQGRYFEYSVVELEAGTEYCLYAQSPDDGVFVDIVSLDNNHPVEFLAIEQEGAFIRVTPTVSGPHALSTITKQPGQATSYTGYAWVPETGSSQTIVDQLTAESVKLDDGTYFDFHEVELAAGTTYVIDVTSDAFDAIAYLFDADNNQLAVNDNAPGNTTDAQITFTPEASGTYYVGVGTPTPDATGGYTARVASGDRIGQDSGVRITRGDAEDHADSDNSAIVGHWQLTQVQQGNQAPQDVPEGAAVYELTADGNTAYYEGGNLVERGSYTLDGNQMTMTDAAGQAETSTVHIDGDTLTVTIEPQPGQTVTLTLVRTNADAPGPRNNPQANTDPAIHGRWNATIVRANNADNEVPAGALAFEFLEDGTFNTYENGRRTGQGTYTTEDGALNITIDGTTENNTYAARGNTLTINTIIPPNTPAIITLQKDE